MIISPIQPISPISLVNQTQQMQKSEQTKIDNSVTNPEGAFKTGTDFGAFLTDAIKQVDELQKTGEVASVGLATGQIQDIHTATIALQKANLSLSMAVEVRNKVLDIYQEMMRMQI